MAYHPSILGLLSALLISVSASATSAQTYTSSYSGKAQKLCDRSNQMVFDGISDRAKAQRNLIEIDREIAAAEVKRDRSAREIERLSAEFAKRRETRPEFADPQEAAAWAEELNQISKDWQKNIERNEEAVKDYNRGLDRKINAQTDVGKAEVSIMEARAIKTELCYTYQRVPATSTAYAPPVYVQPAPAPHYAPAPVATAPELRPSPVTEARPVALAREQVAEETLAAAPISSEAEMTAPLSVETGLFAASEEGSEVAAAGMGTAEAEVIEAETVAEAAPVVEPVAPARVIEAEPAPVVPAMAMAPAPQPIAAPIAPSAPVEVEPPVQEENVVRSEERGNRMKGLRVEARSGYQRTALTDTTLLPGVEIPTDDEITYGAEIGFDIAVVGPLTVGPFVEYEYASVTSDIGPGVVELDDAFGVGGRIGVAVIPRFALYGKVAYSDIAFDAGNDIVSADINRSGLKYGGGIELSLFEGFYLAADYVRVDFGDIGGADFERDNANLGLGFRF